ncbi:hypothetical protein [Streptomyces zagrosensis]|uniref:Uncharacterized protein n=1 Tax=Streptomyces zagrosensis TaxID=1042984 RepID=A0A7W9Q9K6_9ACTN|nr:hypothetical protein [Streptomyces zagrosensis]MBB5936158.1 hypothetical protein [Streptomyces zagrosensis]
MSVHRDRHLPLAVAFRLVRDTQRILDVLDRLHRDRFALRVTNGAFFAMGRTGRYPHTGELPSTRPAETGDAAHARPPQPA